MLMGMDIGLIGDGAFWCRVWLLAVCVGQVNLREFTFMTFVSLEETFMGGNLARKSLMANNELPCWSWSLSHEGIQQLRWGSHTFYDQSVEFGTHPDKQYYEVAGNFERGHVAFGTTQLITMVVRCLSLLLSSTILSFPCTFLFNSPPSKPSVDFVPNPNPNLSLSPNPDPERREPLSYPNDVCVLVWARPRTQVRKTNVTFYYGDALDDAETYELEIPVTDCNGFLSNQVAVGSVGLTAGQMRFFPFALNPTQISESSAFGKLLVHLAKGATYPQVEMDDSGSSGQVRVRLLTHTCTPSFSRVTSLLRAKVRVRVRLGLLVI